MPAPRLTVTLALLIAVALPCRAETADFASFQERAANAGGVLTLPDWPQNADAVRTMMRQTLATATDALGEIARLKEDQVTVANTAAALDQINWQAQTAANIASVVRDTTADVPVREAADVALKEFAAWQAQLEHRGDIYMRLRELGHTRSRLSAEDRHLIDEQLRDVRRVGADRYPESAEAIAKMRTELAQLTSEFDQNIMQARAPVTFDKEELEGMAESFVNSPEIRGADGDYTVAANVMWQFNAVQDNARREETRRRMQIAHDNVAADKNVAVLNRMLALRNEIALRLDYKSWADYRTETQMAGRAKTAEKFVADLAGGLERKFAGELSELQKLKAAETGKPDAKIYVWDWRYYANRLKKHRFAVDAEELRNFFPFENVRDGMLRIYSRIFGLRFDEFIPPQKWTDRMQAFVVSDAATGEPLGVIYLDLFTHAGKTNAGGTSELIAGKQRPDGRYQRPVVAVLLNFQPPSDGKPALLAHEQVEMLFHEFGHALHATLTRAKYARFSGTNVPRDFVEAPSQMLQNWVWDKDVLDTFAADYRDPAKKIPARLIEQMRAAKYAIAAMFYRRQCAFAQMDLTLHAAHPPGQAYDCVAQSNEALERSFLPLAPEIAPIASFRGMNGYDAAYYGYAWSETLAADMATAFEKAPDRYLDVPTGMRLRHEIFEPGGSRDVNLSVERFLGRKPSLSPFLKRIGSGTRAGEPARGDPRRRFLFQPSVKSWYPTILNRPIQ
ncbi:MAG: Zn-dependent oligopeptidase [Verrucomicrobiota bacterium]|nr:Zn-dependent oligopeptidase [Verrucomicrobiota bacterium]